ERQWRCHSLPSHTARPSPSHPHAIVQTAAAATPRSICPLLSPDAYCIAHKHRVRIGEQASPPFRAAAPKHQGSSPQMRDLASPLKPPRLQTLAAPWYCRVAVQPGPVVSGCSRCGTAGPRLPPIGADAAWPFKHARQLVVIDCTLLTQLRWPPLSLWLLEV